MHPVPLDGTDGKVANEPSRVRVSVVEPSGTWTFGLGKKCDLNPNSQRTWLRNSFTAAETCALRRENDLRCALLHMSSWEAVKATFMQYSTAARANGGAVPHAAAKTVQFDAERLSSHRKRAMGVRREASPGGSSSGGGGGSAGSAGTGSAGRGMGSAGIFRHLASSSANGWYGLRSGRRRAAISRTADGRRGDGGGA